ncbi:hypothetical protein, partial [Xanthomonas citri]|uniref:hypothetical protein n=1 Tax=Xanthomonas citri TaxID=346 RepID=UPI001A9761D0
AAWSLLSKQWSSPNTCGKYSLGKTVSGPEVSPHFFLRDQALGGPGGGRRCAHGARFKVIKPEKSADHVRQRSIAEVPV